MNVPYTVLAQHFICQPTGVTIFVTEERLNEIFSSVEEGDYSIERGAKKAEMGISETAVYRHLSHALRIIRQKLSENG